MAIPQRIKQLANDIRTRIKGKEVRESLARGIEEAGNIADVTRTRQASLEAQFQSVIDETTGKDVVSAPEINAARVGADNTIHPNLKVRLDEEQERISSRVTQTMNYLSEFGVNVKTLGAIGDGYRHPLYEMFTTLQEAQQVYPFATSLDNEIDWCASMLGVQKITENGGGVLYYPSGTYMVDFVTKAKGIDITVRGDGQSEIKVVDESRLFHNPNRNNTDATKTDLDNLFRDYHAVFFFLDCNFNIENIEINGNGLNQTQQVGTELWNFVEPVDGLINYWKYFHGVQALYIDNKNPVINITEATVYHCTWNNIVIGNYSFTEMDGSRINISDAVIKESPRDGVSIHNFKNVSVTNCNFYNPNFHSLHIYRNVENSRIKNNLFVLNDDMVLFAPGRLTTQKNFIQVGHSAYDDNIINIVDIDNNQFINHSRNLPVNSLLVQKTVSDLSFTNNRSFNVRDTIRFNYPTLGVTTYTGNTSLYQSSGLSFRPFDGTTGKDNLKELSSLIPRPYKSHFIVENNTDLPIDGNMTKESISLRTFTNKADPKELEEFKLTLANNNGARTIIDTDDIFVADNKDFNSVVETKLYNLQTYGINPGATLDYGLESGAFKKGDVVVATPLFNLPDGVVVAGVWNERDGKCVIRLYNPTNGLIPPFSGDWLVKNIGTIGDIS